MATLLQVLTLLLSSLSLSLPPSLLLQDLVEEDVMILDTYEQVFVWIGRGANVTEKKEALKSAKEYVQTDPSARDMDSTSLIQVGGG